MSQAMVLPLSGLVERVRSWIHEAWRALSGTSESGGLTEEEYERHLVARVQGGGAAAQVAFREIVDQHQRWLVWFLSCLLGSRADAEDVAQEVFVRAFLAIQRFRGDSRLRTWLRRIAINQAFNHRRRHVRHRAEALDEAWEGFTEDNHGDALAAREALIHCLQQLPYVSREILILHHVEELSLKEVAVVLDIGVSAAKMRLKRARDSFREVYGEELLQESAE